ncbi:MFS transporter [Thalassospira marina]|uniref:MFS transporter n=1 Tax=Thalassospira marina TaxID=2048283 RepID=A0A2N3KW17_9PROT|nr:MFS transporter [Thalassospira marina]PKR54762.1 MFS transporter [Thalassospira marina]
MSDDAARRPSIFRDRNFVLFLTGQAISTQGLWIEKIAMSWLAWSLTGSAFWTGLIAALHFAPAFLLGPVFGVFADRIDLRRAAILINALMAATSFFLMALSFAGYVTIGWMVLIATCNGVLASAMTPIRLSLVPAIVSREYMSRAVTYASMNFNLSRLVGPAIGGVVIARFDVGTAFMLNAISYLPFIFVMMLVDIQADRGPETRKRRIWAALGDGARYALGEPMIRAMLLLSCVIAIVGRGMLELMPVFAEGAYDSGVTGLGALSSAAGFGAVISTFVLSRTKSDPHSFQRVAVIGALLSGGAMLALCFCPWFKLAVVLVGLAGFGLTAVGVGSQTALQLAVDNTLRGRVMSFWSATSFGGVALGGTVLGAISQWSDIRLTAGGAGLLIVLVALVAMWRISRAAGPAESPVK